MHYFLAFAALFASSVAAQSYKVCVPRGVVFRPALRRVALWSRSFVVRVQL